jgi:hypothetical protein
MAAMTTSTGGTTATTTAMRRTSEGDGGEEDAKTAPISGQQTNATAHAHVAHAHRTRRTHVLIADDWSGLVSRYGPSGEVLDDYYTYDYASDREFDADDEDDDGGGGDTYGQGAAGGSVYGEFEEMADIHSDYEHMD